jgi:hypothetical protein
LSYHSSVFHLATVAWAPALNPTCILIVLCTGLNIQCLYCNWTFSVSVVTNVRNLHVTANSLSLPLSYSAVLTNDLRMV